jgi:ammonium transporter, Amt family
MESNGTRVTAFVPQFKNRYRQILLSLGLTALAILSWPSSSWAAELDAVKMSQELKVSIDTVWVLIAAILVFFMNCGFAMLEAGLCRQKNTVNILTKNLSTFVLISISFWMIGFGLMFGNGNEWIGANGFFLIGADNSPATNKEYQGVFAALNWAGIPLAAKFFFQLVFASTSATIVSGAVAERIKLVSFFIFVLLFGSTAYPMVGHWVWGGGWLADRGFCDFAGSSVVHVVGGCAALTGAWLLKPRSGKYGKTGLPMAIPGHSMTLATLGCFIMWLGWFGFNPGSTLAVSSTVAHIVVVTNIAAACGGLAATMTTWVGSGKPDLIMLISGILAGLVAITASCAFVNLTSAAIIGAVAGVLVVFAIDFIERSGIDDPVGAVAIHLIGGVWGTLALGLFSQGNVFGATAVTKNGLFWGGGFEQIGIQAIGLVSIVITSLLVSAGFWYILKSTLGLRVLRKSESVGLDTNEHSMEAYPDFFKKEL